jgi:hypothetical protein
MKVVEMEVEVFVWALLILIFRVSDKILVRKRNCIKSHDMIVSHLISMIAAPE